MPAKCFVACMKKQFYGQFLGKSRLYAFPMQPELITKDEFVILDSGAFGLSQRGGTMDKEYMSKLCGYYRNNSASQAFPVLSIAPDKFLDPKTTTENFRFWMNYFKHPVVPVVQFRKKGKVDFFDARWQIEFYSNYNCSVLAISNPGLLSYQCQIMRMITDFARQKNFAWLHCLGAGWNPLDVGGWFRLGFDSIDSISYYTDAEQGKKWTAFSGFVNQSNADYLSLVHNNFKIANLYASGAA